MASYYAIRHDLGVFRCVVVAETYQIEVGSYPLSATDFQSALRAALHDTIQVHPALQLSLHRETASSTEATFIQHSEISFEDMILVKDVANPIPIDANSTESHSLHNHILATELESIHNGLFTQSESVPSWKLVLIRHSSVWGEFLDQSTSMSVAFVFHHGIVDGLSGLAFHETFIEALSKQFTLDDSALSPMKVVYDRPFQKPMSMEEALGFTGLHEMGLAESPHPPDQSLGNTKHYGLDEANLNERPARVQLLEIPQHQLRKALELCKTKQATLTGFLHGLIVSFLARRFKDITSVQGITPCSMRKYTHAARMDMVNHISYLKQIYHSALLEEFRGFQEFSINDVDLIFKIARDFVKEQQSGRDLTYPQILEDAARTLPVLVTSPEQLLHQPRENLIYELSNLGRVQIRDPAQMTPDPRSEHPLARQQNVVLSQCGTGPDLGINCASLDGSALTISITWHDRELPHLVVDDLVRHLAGHFAQGNHLHD